MGHIARHTALLMLAAALVGGLLGALIAAVILLGDDSPDEAAVQATITDRVASEVERVLDQRLAGMQEHSAEQLAQAMSAERTRIADVYQQVRPSVVIIDAEGPARVNEDGVTVVSAALATGFLLDDQGHVVTAAHVLEGMDSITVILANGERREATQLGDDRPFSDVGVLRFETTPSDELAVPSFAEGRDVTPGETVIAIGNTLLGTEIAITVGVISDPDTTFFRERYQQDDLIQTDAALNHGNSGGVLVDLNGAVVGMPAVIARATRDGAFIDGIGFALQIAPVLEVARAIVSAGFYPRPTFGVVNERLLTPAAAAQLDLNVTEGSFLIELERQGAFARAGIRPGDVLRRLNDTPINAETPYLNALAKLEPNVPVTVQIHRGNEDYVLSIAPDLRSP